MDSHHHTVNHFDNNTELQSTPQPPSTPRRVPDSPSRLPVYRANGVLPHHSPMHRGYSERLSTYIPQVTPTSIRKRHEAHNCVFQIQELGSTNSSPPSTASSRRPSHHDLFCPRRGDQMFEKYRPLCEIQKSLKKGEVIEGILRINPKNFEDAYISAPDEGRDIYIQGVLKRNRALNGDLVAVEIDDPSEWKELEDDQIEDVAVDVACHCNRFQKTARVVAVIKELNPRKAVGKIVFQDGNTQFAKFHPRDRRMPRILIPCESCPPEVSTSQLYLATIESWPESSQMPYGLLQGAVGYEGLVEAETWSIILENSIETEEFSSQMSEINVDANFIEEQSQKRLDLREECIFTIDPSTAKDLDDAVSIKPIGNDLFEIGVHIADVTFYVEEGSDIDEWAKRRATTFYLVNQVIPMIPKSLSENICSLNPGHDKLTVSVIWKITSDGEIVSGPNIARSVISSCIKLSYDQAQSMIDDVWEGQKLPIIFGKWTHAQVANNLRKLSQIALKIRKRRRLNGSLTIEKTSLSFDLREADQFPTKMHMEISSDSKKLIEEMMLMANMAVATKITIDHPTLALLRNHPAPAAKMIENSIRIIKSIVPSASNEDLSPNALQKIIEDLKSMDRNLSRAFSHLVVRSMRNAAYFCIGSTNDPKDYIHFALNVDRYTHFTSPIRRYADMIVHRLLFPSEHSLIVNQTTESMTQLAEHCTERNVTSRLVSEQSQKLFFSLFIRHNPTIFDAIVVNILDRSFDALLPFLGLTCRVYLEKTRNTFEFKKEQDRRTLIVVWPSSSRHTIITGISVKILVHVHHQDIYKFEGILQEQE